MKDFIIIFKNRNVHFITQLKELYDIHLFENSDEIIIQNFDCDGCPEGFEN